ncbi:MAG: DUF2203 domain-containing protein [Candidatus Omnitrophica bacterium]|nr:DUF2203 domain-containing protein [Candidatus Omnitrophota bacterium]
MKSTRHIFSLEEANALLAELETLLAGCHERIVTYTRRHDELLMHELLADAEGAGKTPDTSMILEDDAQNVDASVLELEKEIDKLRALGCVIRDMERGWVDFPGRIEGQQVYFCWRRGEPFIRFYHPLKARCRLEERRPIT